MGSGCDSGHETHPDHRLVIAVTGGTHEEFREYVVARGPTLLRAAYQLTGHPSDAEDLLPDRPDHRFEIGGRRVGGRSRRDDAWRRRQGTAVDRPARRPR